MAGHSKFKNIQHRKGAQDKKRAKQFARLTRELTTAAAQSGNDEAGNPRLRTAIQNARAANMPKDNISRAINKSSDKNAADYQEIRYEGFAPGGVGLIVEALSDNRNRAASNIRAVLTKFGGNLGESNAVVFMFKPMGEVFYHAHALTQDEALAVALKADIDDCCSTQEGHFFFCSREEMDQTEAKLVEHLGQTASSRRLGWVATNRVELDEGSFTSLNKIVENLDELEDVRYVFTNGAIDGEPLLYAPIV